MKPFQLENLDTATNMSVINNKRVGNVTVLTPINKVGTIDNYAVSSHSNDVSYIESYSDDEDDHSIHDTNGAVLQYVNEEENLENEAALYLCTVEEDISEGVNDAVSSHSNDGSYIESYSDDEDDHSIHDTNGAVLQYVNEEENLENEAALYSSREKGDLSSSDDEYHGHGDAVTSFDDDVIASIDKFSSDDDEISPNSDDDRHGNSEISPNSADDCIEDIELWPNSDDDRHGNSEISPNSADGFHETIEISSNSDNDCIENIELWPNSNNEYRGNAEISPNFNNEYREIVEISPNFNNECRGIVEISPNFNNECRGIVEISPNFNNECREIVEISPNFNNECRGIVEISPNSEDRRFYHGTSDISASKIQERGIILSYGKSRQDFSNEDGFYLSDNFKYAEKKGLSRQNGPMPTVLIFNLPADWIKYIELNLAKESDWISIIKYNRSGRNLSLVSIDSDLLDRFNKCDYVSGPVSGGKAGSTCKDGNWQNWQPSGFGRKSIQFCVRSQRLAEAFHLNLNNYIRLQR